MQSSRFAADADWNSHLAQTESGVQSKLVKLIFVLKFWMPFIQGC